jgi:thymidylate kinase
VNGFRSALDALSDAGVPYRFRKVDRAFDELPGDGELDVWMPAGRFRDADRVLAGAGFRHLFAPGYDGHRFYLSFQRGSWLKLDAKAAPRPTPWASALPQVRPGTHGVRRGPGAPLRTMRRILRRGVGRIRRRRPVSLRRAGPVVAVLGPDGAGKGTLIARLKVRIPVAVTPLYLGRRPRRPAANGSPPPPPGALRECAGLLRGLVRTWRKLARGYARAWRGDIVLCDRHPIEVLATRPPRTPAGRRLEAFMAKRLVPWPDAIVLLDAPGSSLHQRKGEHSPEVLDRWRNAYAEVFVPRGAALISSAGPRSATVARASEVVWEALRARRRW